MKLSLSRAYARFLAIIRSRTSSIAIVALIAAMFAVTTGWAAERGRVKVQNGTVLSDRNTILRGARMQLVANGYVAPNSYWRYLNATLGLNAIRYGVRTITVGRTVEQQLPALDVAVNRAAANHLYLMINTAPNDQHGDQVGHV